MTDKHPGGRPPKYTDPQDMQVLIDLYFLACKVNGIDSDGNVIKSELLKNLSEKELLIINDIDCVYPTVSGLAYLLGMTTRALVNYEGKEEFLPTVKRAKQRIEMSLEHRLAGNNVTGAIFNLKNNFGWKDKQETEIYGKDGGPIQTRSFTALERAARVDAILDVARDRGAGQLIDGELDTVTGTAEGSVLQ